MKWIAAKVIVEAEPAIPVVERVSAVFEEMGLSGVVVEDPDLEPSEGWGEDALPRPEHHSVTGYFPGNDTLSENRRKLEQGLSEIRKQGGGELRILYQEVDEEDWAESWKAYFWPEKITDTLVVKPTWREYAPAAGEMVMEIDPGMAFGTGTHPTTALCIRMIQAYLKPGDTFLDVGTGSGILMVAAAKLGASRLCGIDSDSVACDIAEKNLRLNGVDSAVFRVKRGHLVDHVSETYDVVAANILSEVILLLLDDVRNAIRPGGVLICSGIIAANRKPVVEKMTAAGFVILDERIEDGWVAIAGRMPGAVSG